METNRQEAERILAERFGKDQVIALATISGQLPSVRYVNAYYADGAFYIITYGLSNKMRQLAENPVAGIAGEWFTGNGRAENLGWFGKEENRWFAAKTRSCGKSLRSGLTTATTTFPTPIPASSGSA